MMAIRCRVGIALAAIILWSVTVWRPVGAAEPVVGPDHGAKMARGLELFKRAVRPVLTQHCLGCHGEKATEAGLDLGDREGLLRGGESGPAVVVGRGKDSLLVKLISHARTPKMPRGGEKLPADAIAAIATWIDLGAPYDGPLLSRKSDASAWTRRVVPEEARRHWAFRPLQQVVPPEVRHPEWCRTPIDRFILARLEAAGLQPNPAVDRAVLVRRAYFDLIGLPPSPEELEAALAADEADWYEQLLDRLLQSPHHGERWGRHWLDLARFAESHGFEHDYDRPTAYPYRDFVIQALNDDLPFDTFVRWQIAGDEYAPDNGLALKATGFLAAGVHSTQITKKEVEKHRYDELDDIVSTIGTAMLGLTIGCARCHDHKYDPIPQADYYRLVAAFTTTVRSELDVPDPHGYAQALALFEREHRPLVEALRRYEAEQLPKKRAVLVDAWNKKPDRGRWAAIDALLPTGFKLSAVVQWQQTLDPEWQKLAKRVAEHRSRAPKPGHVKALISSENVPPLRLHTQGEDFLKETHYLRRGDPAQKEGVATPGFLQVLTRAADAEQRWRQVPGPKTRTSLHRRALAEWLTDVEAGAGPLLARVIVNRLWQHHLGRGLVATPSDFGSRGEPPSHPELLDWLAAELIRHGWRLKPLHRLIMTSAVYQQSSQIDPRKQAVDRDNRLWWRRPKTRLEAEIIRDNLLAVSGQLDRTLYGPGTLDPRSVRRSIYFTVKRSQLLPMMQVFDAPDALQGMGERPTTTIAPQALMLLNNPQVRAAAHRFARRIAPTDDVDTARIVEAGYVTALGRRPRADERAEAQAFIEHQTAGHRAAGHHDSRLLAVADFCQVLMCLNEFVYLE
ncbi:MAG: PSD1 and planctomycete cytochrome C domain-containing protein [Gemmataceae bacterium]|nr:PSD1 and planctomycete cytochrome C domain-containing protein [Gemmataceae bacterium]MDW8266288.1 PSD1 and planctomycete cytochrome C domain-containing protein [Gemmataceae bacterium]